MGYKRRKSYWKPSTSEEVKANRESLFAQIEAEQIPAFSRQQLDLDVDAEIRDGRMSDYEAEEMAGQKNYWKPTPPEEVKANRERLFAKIKAEGTPPFTRKRFPGVKIDLDVDAVMRAYREKFN